MALSLNFSFLIAKSFKWSLLNSNSLWNNFPQNTYFIEEVLKQLQMPDGERFYFRPKEGLFAADNLSTFYVCLSNKICNLSLQAFKHFNHYFLCSISENNLVNNGNSKKLFALFPSLGLSLVM